MFGLQNLTKTCLQQIQKGRSGSLQPLEQSVGTHTSKPSTFDHLKYSVLIISVFTGGQ